LLEIESFKRFSFYNFRKEEGPSKCVDKVCVTPAPKSEVPSEYLNVGNGDLYYLSQEELPWAQAQYECLSRKGYLAELNGKFIESSFNETRSEL
jgi:hypothetical protein